MISKKLYLLVFIAFIGLNRNVQAQSISQSMPVSATTYANTIPGVLTITDPMGAMEITVKFTMTGGYYYVAGTTQEWILTMKSTSTSQVFSVYNDTDSLDNSKYTTSPVSQIPDGTYTVTPSYKRNGTGAVVTGASKINVKYDRSTLPPAVMSPVNGVSYGSTFLWKDSVPESVYSNSKSITFSGPNNQTVLTMNSVLKDSFMLNTNDLASSSANITAVVGPNTLDEGAHSITFTYKDIYGHATASVYSVITIDRTTNVPVMNLPQSGAKVNGNITVDYDLLEAHLSGTLRMIFKNATDSIGITLSDAQPGNNILTLNANTIAFSPGVASSNASTIPDGTYDVYLSCMDALGNPAATTYVTNVTVDKTTLQPTIDSGDTVITTNAAKCNITFTLPETPAAGSQPQLTFTNTYGSYWIATNISTAGTHTISFDSANPYSSPEITSTNIGSIPDGVYTFYIAYQDSLHNPAVVADSKTLRVDRVTAPPLVAMPQDSATYSVHVPFRVSFSEYPYQDKVYVTMMGADTVSLVLNTNYVDPVGLYVNPNNVMNTAGVISSSHSTIPNGVYSVTISYMDLYQNPYSSFTRNAVKVMGVTPPPVVTTAIIHPDCNMSADLFKGITSNTTDLTIEYFSDSALTSAIGNTAGPGTYYVKVTNPYGLTASSSVVVDATPMRPDAPSATGTSICMGEAATVKATVTGTAVWYDQAIGGTILSTASDFYIPQGYINSDTTFYVADSTCIESATRTAVTVTVKSLPDTSLTINNYVLTANQLLASYQWFNCSNFSQMIGEVNQSFIAQHGGSYAVLVTVNGCSAMSTCVPVVIAGVDEKMAHESALNIYPNPNNGEFTIHSDYDGFFAIVNALGQTVEVVLLNRLNNHTASITGLSYGSYYIIGMNEKTITREKLIVTK